MTKCVVSAIVMFIMAFLLSWLVHGVLLHNDYMQMLSWMRKPEDTHALMPWMILAHALFGVAFAWIYYQGKEDKPWLMQGLRYGVAIAVLTIAPTYLIYHVVTPVPLVVAFKQIAFDSVRVVLMGV